MTTGEQYAEQIKRMADNAKAWREAHPDVKAMVQFNYNKRIFMIAPISEAVKNHIVSCNNHGLELLKAMWPWGDNLEPTVMMCKIALESH